MSPDELVDEIEQWREEFNDTYKFAALAVSGDPERGGIVGLTAMLEAQQVAINRLFIIIRGQQKMIKVLTDAHDALAVQVNESSD